MSDKEPVETGSTPESPPSSGPVIKPKKSVSELIESVIQGIFAAKKSIRINSASYDSGQNKDKRSISKEFPLLMSSLFSKDRPSRLIARFVFLNGVGLFLIMGMLVHRALHKWSIHSKERAKLIATRIHQEDAKEMAAEARRESMMSLGTFIVDIKPDPNNVGQRQAMNMVEMDLIVICDNKDTRNYIANHLIQAKNQVTSLLISLERDDFLSKEGKKKLRETLRKGLNGWLSEGKVLDLFIPRLVVG